jgi:hypothetical protein
MNWSFRTVRPTSLNHKRKQKVHKFDLTTIDLAFSQNKVALVLDLEITIQTHQTNKNRPLVLIMYHNIKNV